MPTHPIIDIINGQPTFEKTLDEIFLDAKQGGALKILSPLNYHTERQRKWYKGTCLNSLSDWNGDTPEEWDDRLKKECQGLALLKKDKWGEMERLTIVGVGKRNMTKFINNILSKAIEMEWIISPPDPDLRQQ